MCTDKLQNSSNSCEVRVLVCITAHYVASRLIWLERVLAAFAAYHYSVQVIVYTNEITDEERSKIESLAPKGLSITIRISQHLPHPFDLAWSHKDAILRDFLDKGYTHFIYVEDDMVINVESFDYWRHFRNALHLKGLVPGFVRIERTGKSGQWYATDQFACTTIDWLRVLKFDRWWFTNLDSPYVASFILDQPLAREHVKSPFFTEEKSKSLKPNWGRRERAALGVTYEKVPRFFNSRLVVPFDKKTLQIPTFATVEHTPGNYAEDPASDLAKIPFHKIFKRQSLSCQLASIFQRITRKLIRR